MYPFDTAFLAALRVALSVAATGGRALMPLNRTLTRELRAWQDMLLGRDHSAPITKDLVVGALQRAADALGHTDLRIIGRSLRATCTSNLVAAGFQDRFIKRYGRWTSEACCCIRSSGPPRAPRARRPRRPRPA